MNLILARFSREKRVRANTPRTGVVEFPVIFFLEKFHHRVRICVRLFLNVVSSSVLTGNIYCGRPHVGGEHGQHPTMPRLRRTGGRGYN